MNLITLVREIKTDRSDGQNYENEGILRENVISALLLPA